MREAMKRRRCFLWIFLMLLLPTALVTGCRARQAQTAASGEDDSQYKVYPLRGKIISTDPTTGEVTIAHEAIAGYMEAMTMKFPLKDESLYDKLKVGDFIEATLVVSQNSGHWWLDDVVVKRK